MKATEKFKRDSSDTEGRLLEAAGRIYQAAKQEFAQLGDTCPGVMAELLHSVVMTWANEHVEGRVLSEDEPEYDVLTGALAALGAKVELRSDQQECPWCGYPSCIKNVIGLGGVRKFGCPKCHSSEIKHPERWDSLTSKERAIGWHDPEKITPMY